MKRKLIAFITLITLLITIAAVAQPRSRGNAGPGPGGPEGMRGPGRGVLPPPALAEFLDLSDAQKEQANALRETLQDAIKPLREQSRANREAIRTAIEAGNTTAAAEAMAANEQLRGQMKAEHEKFKASFAAILNAGQKEKFAVLAEIEELRHQRPERANRPE